MKALKEKVKDKKLFTDYWQERKDSNPQPPVLETGALPLSYTPIKETTFVLRVR